jgi:hypothetical protein
MKLLSTANTKTLKGEKFGYKTHILHLAPFDVSGYQVCPKASIGCSLACLNTAGRGKFDNVQNARIRKTKMFFEARSEFMAQIVKDIRKAIVKSANDGMIPLIRLNGTSDIAFEKIRVVDAGVEYRNLMELFPDVKFYDYTAIVGRTVPDNYHLTFSRKESNDSDVELAIANGLNVAVVFDKLPTHYMGLPVISGDDTDIRINDPANVIIGLKAKGKAKKDTTGFVIK